jgi:hypothetical protein
LFNTQVSDDEYSSRYRLGSLSCDGKLWGRVGAGGS